MRDYFTFTEGEKQYLEGVNRSWDDALSPYAAKNREAIRLREPRYNIIRPSYAYDVDVILHSPLYNRYTDKTQVFSFYRNDDLTRRALHVQFVSKIARTIGRALRLNLDLIEAIALAHDMGHTPFGHKGEQFLSECYEQATGKASGTSRYFYHNVHSARIFRYILNGALSLQTLSGILSHDGEKVCKEYTPSSLSTFEEFDSVLERCYVEKDFHENLRPNTLEGCVVRISDMIAYAGKDRQDLYRARLITAKQFGEEHMIGTKNRDIISNLVINIIKNSINSPSLNMDEAVFEDLESLIKENTDVIYHDEELNKPYNEIISPLMKKLYAQLVRDVETRNFDSPVFQHYLNDGIQGRCYRKDFNPTGAIVADPNEIVTDFIASMTDDYFIDICRHLHIDDALCEKIDYHEYFEK